MAESEMQADSPRGGLPFLCRAALAVSIGTVLLSVLGLTVLFVLLWFVHHRHLANWIINLVGLTLVSGALTVFWRTMRSLARRHFRFSLRASLAAMAVLGLAFGMLGNRIRFVARQQQAVWSLWRQGSSTNYYLEFNTDSAWFGWLIKHFGFDPFGRILEVDARTDDAIEALAGHRAEFVDLEYVIFGAGVTDRGLEYVAELRDFPNLKYANFRGSPITDAGLKCLAGWKNLRCLALSSCPRITDAGLAHLVDLPDIEGLALVAKSTTMGLTDAGLVHVGRMSRLQFFTVEGIAISDAGLAQLRGLSRLERLVSATPTSPMPD